MKFVISCALLFSLNQHSRRTSIGSSAYIGSNVLSYAEFLWSSFHGVLPSAQRFYHMRNLFGQNFIPFFHLLKCFIICTISVVRISFHSSISSNVLSCAQFLWSIFHGVLPSAQMFYHMRNFFGQYFMVCFHRLKSFIICAIYLVRISFHSSICSKVLSCAQFLWSAFHGILPSAQMCYQMLNFYGQHFITFFHQLKCVIICAIYLVVSI